MKIPGLAKPTTKQTNQTFAVARAVAANQAEKILRCLTHGARGWSYIEEVAQIKVPADWSAKPCNYLTITQFSAWWKTSATERYLEREIIAPVEIERVHVEQKFESVTLKPQQRKSVDGIVSAWQSGAVHGALLPLQTGKGKSFVCAAIIQWLKDNQYFGWEDPLGFFPPVLYITPRPVVEKTRRTLQKRFGLTDKDVLILHYQKLSSKLFKPFFEEDIEEIFGQKRKIFRWKAWPFLMVIVDESHKTKKEASLMTKRIRALGMPKTGKNPFWLFTSATPGVTVDDMMTFTMLAEIKGDDGLSVTREKWPLWARQFGDPKKPNAMAMKRWADAIGPAYVCPPNDPSKSKTKNVITILDWENDAQRAKYLKAEEDYIKALERAGGSTAASDRGARARATMIFRASEEYIKVESMVARALKLYEQGYAPVFALGFQASMIQANALLAKAGIPRKLISNIWGGQRIIKPEEVFTDDEYAEAVNVYISDDFTPNMWTREQWAKFRKSRRYYFDMLRLDLPQDEYVKRQGWLEHMGLKVQSESERQNEIDNFQEGRSQFCLYTLAAGGVGVDLDQQIPEARPRWLQATICYYAEEYLQALGRCKRIATIQPEVVQESLFFANSIAASHVAPKLGRKLDSINAIASAGIDFSIILEDAVLKRKEAEQIEVKEVVSDEDVNEVDDDDDENDSNDDNE